MPTQSEKADWRGSWVYLSECSLTEQGNNLLVSQSRHSFEIYNRTSDPKRKLYFTLEYAHKLWKLNHNGERTQIVAEAGKREQITVDKPGPNEDVVVLNYNQLYADDDEWNPFRHMDTTGQDGVSYQLEAYTALRPLDADLRPDLEDKKFSPVVTL